MFQVLLDAGFLNKGSSATSGQQRLWDVISEHSAHAHDSKLITALLVAGLFPNITIFKRGKNHVKKIRTREDGFVSFHPSSVVSLKSGYALACCV